MLLLFFLITLVCLHGLWLWGSIPAYLMIARNRSLRPNVFMDKEEDNDEEESDDDDDDEQESCS